MSQSYKNILQEYCHRYQIGLGKYQTVNVGGESHNPEWKSSITVDGKIYIHVGKGSKVSVETELAKQVMQYLKKVKVEINNQLLDKSINDFESLYPNIMKNIFSEKPGVIIDVLQSNRDDKLLRPTLEEQKDTKKEQIYALLKPSDFKKKLAVFINFDNIKIDEKLPIEFPDIDFYIFMSPTLGGIVNYSPNLENIIIKEVKYKTKDTCDHLISYHLGLLSKYYQKILVCTKDEDYGVIIEKEFGHIYLNHPKSLSTELKKNI